MRENGTHHRSNFSSTYAPNAGRSAQSSTSTGTELSCRRIRAWCAANATLLSLSSPSRRSNTAAHHVRSGKRRGFLVGPFRSTCTTCPLSVATVASRARSRSGSSWTLCAVNACSFTANFAMYGSRRARRCGRIVGIARTTSSLLPAIRRARMLAKHPTWSMSASTAFGCGRSMPLSLCGTKASSAAQSVNGSVTPNLVPVATSRRCGSSVRNDAAGALGAHERSGIAAKTACRIRPDGLDGTPVRKQSVRAIDRRSRLRIRCRSCPAHDLGLHRLCRQCCALHPGDMLQGLHRAKQRM
mmetsp:Transcript_102537/g.201122  ORF Transcript_102537/g.201122 Transcript_102537/m.201122 type:complete len:299 (+) Transcript_102537:21-917(+)